MPTETLRPNAAGTSTQCNKSGCDENWDCVNDVSPDADTYVSTQSEYPTFKIDTYGLSDSEETDVITSVKVVIRGRHSHGGAPTECWGYGKVAIYTHATLYYGDKECWIYSFGDKSKTWTKNPNTDNDWTWAEVNALEAGVALCSALSQYRSFCTQVYVEVDHAPLQQSVGGGAITPSGTLGRNIFLSVGSGSITPAGVLGRLIKIVVGSGGITPSGILGAHIVFFQTVGQGALAIAGALTRLPKIIVGAGSIVPSGTLGRFIKRTVGEGSITPSGSLSTVLRFVQAVGEGAVAIAGTLVKKIALTVGQGAITPTGSLLYRLGRNISITVIAASYRSISTVTALYRKVRGETMET